MGISSLFNRFSLWAEKQPAIKLEKTLTEMEGATKYAYEGREEEFAAKIKGLFKDGAAIGTAELNRVLKVENNKEYWINPGYKVSQAIIAAGVVPDDETYTLGAVKRGLNKAKGAWFLREHLEGDHAVSAAAMRYAIECHGNDVELINSLIARGSKLTANVLFSALHPENLPQGHQLDIVEKLVKAGAEITENSLVRAIRSDRAEVALYLIDAGAPVSALQMAYAVAEGMRAVVEKLHEKGVSFDDAILKCEDKDLQARVKQYRKAITGEAYVDEAAFAALEKQVKTLTARLEKMEAANAPAAKPAATPKATAVKPAQG